MSKFKVGDRVVVIAEDEGYEYFIGKTGVITNYKPLYIDAHQVKFDDNTQTNLFYGHKLLLESVYKTAKAIPSTVSEPLSLTLQT